MKVLFVCSGNICRSPMAAAYFRHRAARGGLAHVLVDSAGTLGIDGAPAADEARLALAELGIDLSEHRSKGLRSSQVASSDLLVAMERGHLETVARRYPGERPERRLLREFENGAEPMPHAPDLVDPMGQPLPFYREQLTLITRCLDHLVLHLKHRR